MPVIGGAVVGGGGAGLPSTVQNKTAAYTALSGDLVRANATAGGFTITLPSAPATGALVTVQKVDISVNIVTVIAAGAGTILGDTSAYIDTQWGGAVLEHLGADVWTVTGQLSTTGPAGPMANAVTNTQTGTTYTLVLGDSGVFITMNNAAASTLIVPPNASVALPIGTQIEGAQLGAGQVTITPGAGVTINATPGLKVAAQYGVFGLRKIATNTWIAYGRLSS